MKVLTLANETYERLRESGLMAKTIIIEFKTIKYNIKQRSTTFSHYIFERCDIVKASLELLKILWPLNEPVRLIGIRFMHLRDRTSAPRSNKNKSDLIDLCLEDPGLPWPCGFVPPAIKNCNSIEKQG
jgi:hypothetical protein